MAVSGMVVGGLLVGAAPLVAGQSTDAHQPPIAAPWTLERVITTALAQHPLVEAAQDRLAAARGEHESAGALPNPVATLWAENARFPGQAPLTLSPETSAYLTLPIEPFLQRGARLRRADLDLSAAGASVTLAERAVVRDAVGAYFRVALAQAQVEAAEENRRGLERLTAYNRARVGEGVTPEVNLLRLELETERASTELALGEAGLATVRAALLPFVGGGTDALTFQDFRVVVSDTIVAPGPAAPAVPRLDELLSRARDKRPELLAGRAREAAAAATIDVERSLAVRQLGATVGMKRTESQTSMIAGVSITVPLFDRNHGAVARATGDRAAAGRDLDWTDRTVAAEVTGAYHALEPLTRQMNTLRPSYLARAQEVEQLTVAAYQEGGATLLQALDASRALADARLTWARALVATQQGLFDLAVSAGSDPLDALNTLRGWAAGTQEPKASGGGR